jgi:5-methylcytosine-specific restriction endonuclease McrA
MAKDSKKKTAEVFDPKLSAELVPRTAWYSNLRSHLTNSAWDKVRKKCYFIANYKCEICGDTGINQGYPHPVECHEVWRYDDENSKQILIRLIALCPLCHKVKHAGLAQMKGESDLVIKQLMKVNEISKQKAVAHLKKCFAQWEERNQIEWKTDVDYIKKYLKD